MKDDLCRVAGLNVGCPGEMSRPNYARILVSAGLLALGACGGSLDDAPVDAGMPTGPRVDAGAPSADGGMSRADAGMGNPVDAGGGSPEDAGPPAAPVVDRFEADPQTIVRFSSTTLTWETTRATSVTINTDSTTVLDGGPADGTLQVTPDATTTYTLVAMDDRGQMTTSSVQVTVTPAPLPRIVTFAAQPSAIDPGQTTNLVWNVENATQVTVTDGRTTLFSGDTLVGTVPVSPEQTTTYIITVVGIDPNETATRLAAVSLNPGATIVSFTASSPVTAVGRPVELTWEVENARGGIEITTDGQTIVTSTASRGTIEVTPTSAGEASYELIARSPAGDAATFVQVRVQLPPPQIDGFTASASPVGIGDTVTLRWIVQFAEEVIVRQNGVVIFSQRPGFDVGSVDATIDAADTGFVLEVLNENGGATSLVSVIGHTPPQIRMFLAAPIVMDRSAVETTLTWNAQSVSGLTLTANGVPVSGFTPIDSQTTTNSQGTIEVPVTEATTFLLTARSGAGSVSASRRVAPAVDEGEFNGDLLSATQIPTDGTPIRGTHPADFEQDYFTFQVPAGGSVRVETSDGLAGCPFPMNTRVSVSTLDPTSGNVVSFITDNNFGCTLIDPQTDARARNLAGGTYWVSLVHFFDEDPFDYVLVVNVAGP